ncbi:MAG: hypothetical protein JWN68_288 [Nocardioides sp.]|jgi:Mce-associated membrane protein|uniref:hypothetical protein n=1 Tax=Nocardioides sp. TaxID=35761 RepID=UPI00260CAE6F|nr:hypothetical protein [Nocardioides sp.]MCW2832335.1 hypothetical protein [Nocardioides sp.]
MSTVTTSSSRGTERATARPPGVLGSAWLAALLTAVVVGLAVFVGFKAYDVLSPAPVAAPEATQITDEDARSTLLVAAAELSQRVLTYHHDSFEEDIRVASAQLAPEFEEEYAQAMKRVRANTARNRISQEATAVASAIISATQDEAQVLVFVNQTTTSARTEAEQVVRNRLVVDLVRVDGDWTIAGVDALG